MRPSAVLAVFLSASALVAGCIETEEKPASEPASLDAAQPLAVDAAPAAFAAPEHVGSCVEQIRFGALTGDAVWAQVWNDVGQTDGGASAYCTQLGTDDPVQLAQVHEGWLHVQAFLAASEEAPAPEPAAPAAPPAPVAVQTYGTCKEAIAADGGNYRRGIDPEYDYYDDRDGDGIVCES